ncbi:thioredoxin-disulfide reductase [Candidatus Bathyarchaeota archaeon]|nr:MAG: thioredoxin-disulfide reductase [Candidatus Bathyarchaeota archaeon]
MRLYDLVIIGGGPAGLTAGIYAGRSKLKTLLLAGAVPGGQIYLTYQVENYPGFPGSITGPDLVDRLVTQVKRFGAELREEEATRVDFSSKPYRVYVGEEIIESRSVIIATGSSNRLLGLESEKRLMGRGVFVCATCDAALYEDLKVVAVGGGDSALQEALDITKFASEVVIVHRNDVFSASRYLIDEVEKNDKITSMMRHTVEEILGEKYVDGVRVRNRDSGEETIIQTDGVLIAIGWDPNTRIFRGQLELTEKGYIVADGVLTSIPGVFVAGDLNDTVYRQVITACGSGCKAALEAEKYLSREALVK